MMAYQRQKYALKLGAGLAGLLLLGACDGPNRFTGVGGPTPGSAEDPNTGPEVEILQPRGADAARPLGDSLFVEAHVSDPGGVTSVSFVGIELRGDPDLGTNEDIVRFEQKDAVLPATVDTTLTRYLQPTPDTARQATFIIVTARDADGNVTADTVTIVLGGPAVELVDPPAQVAAGSQLVLEMFASDPTGLTSLEFVLEGLVNDTIGFPLNPPAEDTTFSTIVDIPAAVDGIIEITANAFNTRDFRGADGPVQVQVVSGQLDDDTPPGVRIEASAPERMELNDFLDVLVTGNDGSGTGVKTVITTVFATNAGTGVRVAYADTVTYPTPLSGTVTERFQVPVINVDRLNLPDTLVWEVTGVMIDNEGNCAAAVGDAQLLSLACTTSGGVTFARDRAGLRIPVTVVAGRTVGLPAGGRIMDAVVDTVRRNLFLSNYERDRVEVFRLQEELFLPAVAVGSEPWGLSLNRGGDTLLVGNSGGTNVSMVALGPTTGLGPIFEDPFRRLLTPDAVLFEIESREDQDGITRFFTDVIPDEAPPGFSDRPQFLAVDSTGRVLYSTKTTILGDVGTIRKAFVPPGGVAPEVVLFFEHQALIDAEEFTAIGRIDDIAVQPGTGLGGVDQVILFDHPPGFPNTVIQGGPADIPTATAELAAQGSDILAGRGRFDVPGIGFADTTFVTASGDGGWVVFGEGAVGPVGRIIMYNAANDVISAQIPVDDLMINASETVGGIGLNYDGTLGVARGSQAYFFTTDLRLQGVADLPAGGSGAALHPLHANAVSLENSDGEYRPDTHLAFVGTGERTVDIIDTFHFFRSGRVFIRDVLSGPLKASLPFPEDNAGLNCPTMAVQDQAGNTIGQTVRLFNAGDFTQPLDTSVVDDACVVVKLYGVTDTGGVAVIDVRKADILRDNPARLGG